MSNFPFLGRAPWQIFSRVLHAVYDEIACLSALLALRQALTSTVVHGIKIYSYRLAKGNAQ